MNRWVAFYIVLLSALVLVMPGVAWSNGIEEAREALAQQEDDEDSTRQLEEVFEAAERNYSLLRAGRQSLNYSFDYAYAADQRLDLEVIDNSIRNLDVSPQATHTFTNAFSYDYGLRDNVTIGTRIPLVTKYDTQEDLSVYDVGDISFTTRWQPNPYVPGRTSMTLFSTFTSKTGVSPYEIDVNRQLSTGSGYYSLAGGLSMSRVLDPVVIYGSASGTYNMPVKDLNQVRGARLLRELHPGFGVSGSAGFSYSLSYDISLSMSVQVTYSDETTLKFSDGTSAVARDQMAGLMNFSLGTRVSDKTIVNTSVGFGLTNGAPDFSLGVSLPINISGLSGS